MTKHCPRYACTISLLVRQPALNTELHPPATHVYVTVSCHSQQCDVNRSFVPTGCCQHKDRQLCVWLRDYWPTCRVCRSLNSLLLVADILAGYDIVVDPVDSTHVCCQHLAITRYSFKLVHLLVCLFVPDIEQGKKFACETAQSLDGSYGKQTKSKTSAFSMDGCDASSLRTSPQKTVAVLLICVIVSKQSAFHCCEAGQIKKK